MGYKVISLPWTANIPNCDIVIAHSFGAGYAVKRDPNCNVLITMDARRWDFWNNSRLKKPNNCIHHFNFYQDSGFSGYKIQGAINKYMPNGHIDLPKNCFYKIMLILDQL